MPPHKAIASIIPSHKTLPFKSSTISQECYRQMTKPLICGPLGSICLTLCRKIPNKIRLDKLYRVENTLERPKVRMTPCYTNLRAEIIWVFVFNHLKGNFSIGVFLKGQSILSGLPDGSLLLRVAPNVFLPFLKCIIITIFISKLPKGTNQELTIAIK